MRIALACLLRFVIGCQCDTPKVDAGMKDAAVDASLPDQATEEDAASVCVKCDPVAGGACTPSRCAKSGDVYCCVF